MEEGPLAGYPLQDLKFTLQDGAYHAVDSSTMAFEAAAKGAYRQSVKRCSPQIMEPIMKVDVFTPEDHVGDVIGDLNRRRGMIKSQDPTPTGVRIKADVSLSEMFGYIGSLRTMTSGRGQFDTVNKFWENPRTTTAHVQTVFLPWYIFGRLLRLKHLKQRSNSTLSKLDKKGVQ